MPSVEGRNEFRQESERIAAETARQAVETLHRRNAEGRFPPEPPGLGAVGGYVVSPDTVEGITENEEMIVWDSAIEVVTIMGLIKEQHEDGGLNYFHIYKQ